MIADIDIESEAYRSSLGSMRFDLVGAMKALLLKRYRARLSYLPAVTHNMPDKYARATAGGGEAGSRERGGEENVALDANVDEVEGDETESMWRRGYTQSQVRAPRRHVHDGADPAPLGGDPLVVGDGGGRLRSRARVHVQQHAGGRAARALLRARREAHLPARHPLRGEQSVAGARRWRSAWRPSLR